MDKIFDKEVESYLIQSGVSSLEVARIKHDKLKEFAISRLKEITTLLEDEKYNDISKFTGFSSAGDGWGENNNYINFAEVCGLDSLDIVELCNMLQTLKQNQLLAQ